MFTSPPPPLTPPPATPAGRRLTDDHGDRVRSLSDEVDRLRRVHDVADDRAQTFVLKLTEIQLNLAVQDKTLGKLEAAVNGNGRPGLGGRVDAVERVAAGLTRAVWLLATAAMAGAVKLVFDRVH